MAHGAHRTQAEAPEPRRAEQVERHHGTARGDPRRNAHHQGIHSRAQDDRTLRPLDQRLPAGFRPRGRAPGLGPPRQRVPRHGAHRPRALVRRHAHLLGPFADRRADIYLLHGHPLLHHPASQGLFEGFLQHSEGYGLHGTREQDSGCRKPHHGTRRPAPHRPPPGEHRVPRRELLLQRHHARAQRREPHREARTDHRPRRTERLGQVHARRPTAPLPRRRRRRNPHRRQEREDRRPRNIPTSAHSSAT